MKMNRKSTFGGSSLRRRSFIKIRFCSKNFFSSSRSLKKIRRVFLVQAISSIDTKDERNKQTQTKEYLGRPQETHAQLRSKSSKSGQVYTEITRLWKICQTSWPTNWYKPRISTRCRLDRPRVCSSESGFYFYFCQILWTSHSSFKTTIHSLQLLRIQL